MKNFLVIQPAFIGDAILASSVLEKLHNFYPGAKIDFFVRKGNESLYKDHPFLNQLFVWDKKQGKYKNLFRIIKEVRKTNYDYVVNLHRFSTSGILTWFSKAQNKVGYDKNPFSFSFTIKYKHELNGLHEVERYNQLIEYITDSKSAMPKLYPSKDDFSKIETYSKEEFVTMAPASVWFTKMLPKEKWIELCNETNEKIYLVGAPNDKELCQEITSKSTNSNIKILCGKLTLLQSAALMSKAKMNYVNDSAPMHLCSAINAPTTAFFCSTIPKFGFGPLSNNSIIKETKQNLDCRPCGLHGKKECPKGHFDCGYKIEV